MSMACSLKTLRSLLAGHSHSSLGEPLPLARTHTCTFCSFQNTNIPTKCLKLTLIEIWSVGNLTHAKVCAPSWFTNWVPVAEIMFNSLLWAEIPPCSGLMSSCVLYSCLLSECVSWNTLKPPHAPFSPPWTPHLSLWQWWCWMFSLMPFIWEWKVWRWSPTLKSHELYWSKLWVKFQ